MSDYKEQVHVYPSGNIEILHGEAPKPKRTINPDNFRIEGNIYSPRKYLQHHGPTILDPIVHFSYEGIIILELNHRKDLDQRVYGSVEPSVESNRLKLGEKFSLKSLAEHLKLNKDLCADHEEIATIISSLQKFKGTVTQHLSDWDDQAGSKHYALEQQFEHDIQTTFTAQFPAFKGGPPENFTVEILMDVRDGQVAVWLQSYGYHNSFNKSVASLISAEISEIEKMGYLCIEQ